MKKNNIKKELEDFIGVLKKINIKYLQTLLADASFIIIFFLGGILLSKVLSKKAVVLQSLQNMQPELMESTLADMRGFVFMAVSLVILFLLFALITFSLSQGFTWNRIFNKKNSFNFFKRFTLLNLVCLPFYIALIVGIAIALTRITNLFIGLISPYISGMIITSIIAFLFIVLIIGPMVLYFLNLINIIYIYFMKEHKIFRSIKDMFVFILNKGTKLYIPFVLSTLFFFIISLILLIFKLVPRLYTIFAIIFLLSFLTWMRFYLKEKIDKI